MPFTITLYLALIPTLGAKGAAIASCLSYALTSLVTWMYFRRICLGLREAFMPTRLDVADYRTARSSRAIDSPGVADGRAA